VASGIPYTTSLICLELRFGLVLRRFPFYTYNQQTYGHLLLTTRAQLLHICRPDTKAYNLIAFEDIKDSGSGI